MVSHDYYLNFRVIRYIFAFYSVVRIQEIIFIYSPHTPHPTPHTLHPTPYTPHPNQRSLDKKKLKTDRLGGRFY
ncbi:MAG: hypothetical protein ACK5N6_02665 [Microcystis sp.]|uniref:hypothetical protein n=1 Tax=Microcystis sp. TaxID=1127 RepID=UPI0039189951